MRHRRDPDHHSQTLTFVVGALGLAALVVGAPARADVLKMGVDGTVYRADVDFIDPGPGRPVFTLLRWTAQRPDGMVESSIVPGTDDLALERDPAVDVDPATGEPVLAWARSDRGPYQIMIARLTGAGWTHPTAVDPAPVEQTQPEIRISPTLVHVFWRQAESLSGCVRVSLDRDDLTRSFGPEPLPLPVTGVIPASGSPPGGSTIPASDACFFSALVKSRLPGNPDCVVVWGVRDAPVPVDFVAGVQVSADAHGVWGARARWIFRRFVLTYWTFDRLFYNVQVDGTWSETREILFAMGTGPAGATARLEETLRASKLGHTD